MTACPACQTMLTRPGAAHRDITGTHCPGLPDRPACSRCGHHVAVNEHGRAGHHYRDATFCLGSDRRITTPELWASRPENLEHDEEAA